MSAQRTAAQDLDQLFARPFQALRDEGEHVVEVVLALELLDARREQRSPAKELGDDGLQAHRGAVLAILLGAFAEGLERGVQVGGKRGLIRALEAFQQQLLQALDGLNGVGPFSQIVATA